MATANMRFALQDFEYPPAIERAIYRAWIRGTRYLYATRQGYGGISFLVLAMPRVAPIIFDALWEDPAKWSVQKPAENNGKPAAEDSDELLDLGPCADLPHPFDVQMWQPSDLLASVSRRLLELPDDARIATHDLVSNLGKIRARAEIEQLVRHLAEASQSGAAARQQGDGTEERGEVTNGWPP
jgi:hypothetical protein